MTRPTTAGAALAYVSTDWVFDGTQGGADERTPPNPINLYGALKAFSELVVHERAERGLVARVAGVMGSTAPQRAMPRSQDAGFGYFVASLVDALSAGEPFVVWTSEAINMRATPSLASESAAMLVALVEGDHTGDVPLLRRRGDDAGWSSPARPPRCSSSTPGSCATARPIRPGSHPRRSRTTRPCAPSERPRRSATSSQLCATCCGCSAPSANAPDAVGDRETERQYSHVP